MPSPRRALSLAVNQSYEESISPCPMRWMCDGWMAHHRTITCSDLPLQSSLQSCQELPGGVPASPGTCPGDSIEPGTDRMGRMGTAVRNKSLSGCLMKSGHSLHLSPFQRGLLCKFHEQQYKANLNSFSPVQVGN